MSTASKSWKQSCATCRFYDRHTDPYQPSRVFKHGTCEWLESHGPEWMSVVIKDEDRKVFDASGQCCPVWEKR